MAIGRIEISQMEEGIPKGTDIVPGVDPTDTSQATSGTNFKYLRSDELNFILEALGLDTKSAVLCATTSNYSAIYDNGTSGIGATLTNSGSFAPFSADGITPSIGDRILMKNQSSQLQNGIYTLTVAGNLVDESWVMTRATDFDQSGDIVQDVVMFVNQGAVNRGLLFQETAATPLTIGTDAITFAQYFISQSPISVPVSLADGGTGASLVPSNGGIVYSSGSALDILAGTSTANLPLLSQSNAAPVWGAFALNLGGALTTAGALTTIGAFNATFNFTGVTNVTFPTSGTLATTGELISGAPLTRVNDTNVTLTLGGNPNTALVNAASLTLGWSGQLGLSRGGTNTDLSATGGASQVLKQTSLGSNITVGQLAASDLSNGTTGSGAVVLASSPSLIDPALGTPASGNLSNCTSLPISTGVSGLGTGVSTFLGTPSSANLMAALTDEISPTSGLAVFGLNWTTTTAVVTLNGAGTAPQYTTSNLRYCQIGKIVFVELYLTGDGGNEGSGAGQIRIAVPITRSNNAGVIYWGVYGEAVNGTTAYYLMPRFNIQTAVDLYYISALNVAPVAMTGADQNNTSREINMVFWYEAA